MLLLKNKGFLIYHHISKITPDLLTPCTMDLPFLYNLFLLFAASQIHSTGNGTFLMQDCRTDWGLFGHPDQQQPLWQQQVSLYFFDPVGQTPPTSAAYTAGKQKLLLFLSNLSKIGDILLGEFLMTEKENPFEGGVLYLFFHTYMAQLLLLLSWMLLLPWMLLLKN